MQQLYDRISKLEKAAMELLSSMSIYNSEYREFEIKRKSLLQGKAMGYGYVLSLIEEIENKNI